MVVGQDKIDNDIVAAFNGEKYENEKKVLATHVMAIGKAWCDSQPKEFNSSSLSRGEIRKRRRENKKALQTHINEQLTKDKKAAEDVHAVQFLGIMSLILLAILSAVISWVTQKLLDDYYD
jgi:hypothetical protein